MESVRDWVERFYKGSRLELDNEIAGYREIVIRSHEVRVAARGETVISRHDSRTGAAEWYRPVAQNATTGGFNAGCIPHLL